MSRSHRELTPTEISVLQALWEHGTVREAAEALHLSRHTVDAHLDHMRQRTGLHHLSQIMVWATIKGYLKPGSDRI